MSAPSPRELIVIARANFVDDNAGRRFQNLDGAYLDSLAPLFHKLWLVAVVFRKGRNPEYDRLQNYTYRFQSPNIVVVEISEGQTRKQLMTILRLLRDHPRALVYVFFPTFRAAFTALACRLIRRPYLVYSGGMWGEVSRLHGASRPKAWLCEQLERWAFRGAAARLFTPRTLIERYRRCGPTERARPVTTVQVLPAFQPRPLGQPPRVLCVAAVLPLKGHDTLLRAVSQLQNRGLTVQLDLIGAIHEDWKTQLDALASQLGVVAQVHYHGWIADRQQLAEHYRRADLFVLASRSEGFPRVLLEAMGFGLPVISTNIPNIAGVVDDRQTAWLVPPDHPEALADAIATLIADHDARQQLAERGWRWVCDQLRETPAEQFARLLNTLNLSTPPS